MSCKVSILTNFAKQSSRIVWNFSLTWNLLADFRKTWAFNILRKKNHQKKSEKLLKNYTKKFATFWEHFNFIQRTEKTFFTFIHQIFTIQTIFLLMTLFSYRTSNIAIENISDTNKKTKKTSFHPILLNFQSHVS